jgi:very-short-patch-repair endonuclease
VKGYIADFCCPEKKLIIELDGGQHLEQREYDDQRTTHLASFGYKVLRFWNGEISENLDGVLEAIYAELNKPSP